MELLDWTRDPEHDVFTSVTGTDGMAAFYREKNSCEDIIRPFRKTVMLVDLTWASVNVLAKSYQPVEQMWLHGSRFEDHGSFRPGDFHRLTFNIPLRR